MSSLKTNILSQAMRCFSGTNIVNTGNNRWSKVSNCPLWACQCIWRCSHLKERGSAPQVLTRLQMVTSQVQLRSTTWQCSVNTQKPVLSYLESRALKLWVWDHSSNSKAMFLRSVALCLHVTADFRFQLLPSTKWRREHFSNNTVTKSWQLQCQQLIITIMN